MAKELPCQENSISNAISQPHVLVEVDDLNTSISKSIKSSSRLKFTCFDISQKYLALGANSGGIYFYARSSTAFLQLIPNHDGPVRKLLIAPDEKRIGFSTRKGVVVILELNEIENSLKVNRRFVSHEHQGWTITSLIWSDNSHKLFVGDDAGKVSVCEMAVKKAKKLFDDTAIVIKTDHAIVQLDFFHNNLLVSNYSKCFLCDVLRERFSVIGSKPREGEYGACFFPDVKNSLYAYCARPGSRMWEVDGHAVVIHTHQFKNILATPPFNVVSFRNDGWNACIESIKPQSIAFKKLFVLTTSSRLILAWSDGGIYLFDVKRANLVLWSSDIKGIKDLKVLNNHIYTFSENGSIQKFSILLLEKAIGVLHSSNLTSLASSLCIHFEEDIVQFITSTKSKKLIAVLMDMKDKLDDNSVVKGVIENILSKTIIDALSIEPWTSQENVERISCSPTISELSFRRNSNGVVVVNSGNTSHQFDSDQDSEFGLEDEAFLRKSTSLPSINQISRPDCKNSASSSTTNLPDEMDKFSMQHEYPDSVFPNHSDSLYEELPDGRRSRTTSDSKLNQLWLDNPNGKKATPNTGHNFTYDDFDDEYLSLPNDPYQFEPSSAYFLPMYGIHPRYSSNTAYSELLEGIEFDKLKEKFSSKLNTGKKVLLYNIKEIEDRILPRQAPTEVFDVRSEDEPDSTRLRRNESCESFDEPLVNNDHDFVTESRKLSKTRSYPVIDSSQLIHATELALSELENAETLYDPSICGKVLLSWVDVLHKCQLALLGCIASANQNKEADLPVMQNEDSQLSQEVDETNGNGGDISIVSTSESIIDDSDMLNANVSLDNSTNKDTIKETSPPNETKSSTSHIKVKEPTLSVIFYQDPFGLSEDHHSKVAKMAQFCVQSNIFGHMHSFDNYLSDTIEMETMSHSSINLNLTSPDESENKLSCQSCMDCQLSIFMKLYFHLLDATHIHQMTFESLHSDCCCPGMFNTWKSLMKCLQSTEHDRKLKYELSHHSSTLDNLLAAKDVDALKIVAVLYRLMSIAPDQVMEVCVKKSDVVNPIDVLYLCTPSHSNLFVSYMQNLLQQSMFSKKKLFESWLIRSTWLEAVFKSNTKPELRCECGYPSPASHTHLWPNEQISLVLEMTTEPEYEQKVMDMCFKYSYWTGYLEMIRRVGKKQEILNTVVSLSDLNLLKMKGNNPKSEEDWKYVVDLLLKQDRNEDGSICINCGANLKNGEVTEPLILQSVVKEMLKVMLPKKVISLLHPLHIKKNQLSSSLFQASIILSILNQQQSNIADQMLKQYDTQLWSKRSRNIPSQIMQMFRYEISNKKERFQFDLPESQLSGLQSDDIGSTINSSLLLQPDLHWGTTASLSDRCLYCNLKLSGQIDSNESSLIIFPCGHSYHTACATNKCCLKCAS